MRHIHMYTITDSSKAQSGTTVEDFTFPNIVNQLTNLQNSFDVNTNILCAHNFEAFKRKEKLFPLMYFTLCYIIPLLLLLRIIKMNHQNYHHSHEIHLFCCGLALFSFPFPCRLFYFLVYSPLFTTWLSAPHYYEYIVQVIISLLSYFVLQL